MDKGIVGALAFVAIASAGSFVIQYLAIGYNAPARVDAANTAPAAPVVEAAARPIAGAECYRFLDRLTRVSPLLKRAAKIEQIKVSPNIYEVTYIYSYGEPYLGGVGCGTSGKMEFYSMDIGGPPSRLIPYEKASLDIISAAIFAYTGDDAHAVDMAESILEKQPKWVAGARVEFGLPGGGKISIGGNDIFISPARE